MKVLNKKKSVSILIGDVTIKTPKIEIPRHGFVFCVFINNLKENDFNEIDKHLKNIFKTNYFCGIEVDFKSDIRDIIFDKLIPFLIKKEKYLILQKHDEEYFFNSEYKVIPIELDENDIDLFHSFLQFKIRVVNPTVLSKNDTEKLFSIITGQKKIPYLEIHKDKKTYFETGNHSKKILKAFNQNIDYDILIEKIKNSIELNYIYDFKIIKNHSEREEYLLFAAYININDVAFTVSLEYKKDEEKMFVTSMY